MASRRKITILDTDRIIKEINKGIRTVNRHYGAHICDEITHLESCILQSFAIDPMYLNHPDTRSGIEVQMIIKARSR